MLENESNSSITYDIKKKDPNLLLLLIKKYVNITLRKNVTVCGFIHSIDPIDYSIIVLEVKGEGFQTTILPGHAILNVEEVIPEKQITLPLKTMVTSVPSRCYQERKNKIISWFKQNLLTMTESATHLKSKHHHAQLSIKERTTIKKAITNNTEENNLNMSVALLPLLKSNTSFSESDSNSFCDNNQIIHPEKDKESVNTTSLFSKSAKLKQQTVLQLLEKSASYDDGGDRHIAITQSLVYMIIKDNLPFSCVEKEGLKQFVHIACPRYKLPSRFKVSGLIEQRYSTTKAILINHLQETRYITMSSDIVTITTSTRSFLIIIIREPLIFV